MSVSHHLSGRKDESTGRLAGRIMVAVLASRILGLVREVLMNALFGAGRELDAFLTAFRIPNLLRDLFAEGALSTAFVTVFSKRLATEGAARAFDLSNRIASLLALVMSAVVLMGMLLSPWLVGSLAPAFAQTPGKLELTVNLARVLWPFILFVSMAALWMGLLNSMGSFGLPASASCAFNGVSILVGFGLAWWMDPSFGARGIFGFAVGTLLGGLVQWLILMPRAFQLGYRVRWLPDWRDPGVKQVVVLMGPAVVGGAAVQVNVLVNIFFASGLGDGAVTWLNNAFRLMQLPIGLFGVAIATVTLPAVSRAVVGTDPGEFSRRLSESLRVAFFLTVPAAVGLALAAVPIMAVVYQHGRITALDTSMSAWALQGYAGGLAFYAAIKVMAPPFYAMDRPWIPLRVSLLGIILNFSFNVIFIHVLGWGLISLALATSLAAFCNFLQLSWAMQRLRPGVFVAAFWVGVGKTALASLVMAGWTWVWVDRAQPWMTDGFLRALILVMGVSSSALVYGGVAWLIRQSEARALLEGVLYRLVKTSRLCNPDSPGS